MKHLLERLSRTTLHSRSRGEDLFWDGESKLVLQYVGVNAPELDRSEWGGVRIETRRFQHQP